MRWIQDYQLFLFDFDGLLVNTEEIHFLAYKRMCTDRGFNLDWDFNRYCQAAHYQSEAVKEQIYKKFPALKAIEPDWKVLYSEKKAAVFQLLNEGAVHLMPGVDRMLKTLQDANVKRCVVTHSPHELISVVRRKNPVLDTIPYWVTREDYAHPKPNPECYVKAIEKFALKTDNVIGFEDTPRGLTALLGTRAKPVLVCQADYPEIPAFLKQGALHFRTLEKMMNAE